MSEFDRIYNGGFTNNTSANINQFEVLQAAQNARIGYSLGVFNDCAVTNNIDDVVDELCEIMLLIRAMDEMSPAIRDKPNVRAFQDNLQIEAMELDNKISEYNLELRKIAKEAYDSIKSGGIDAIFDNLLSLRAFAENFITEAYRTPLALQTIGTTPPTGMSNARKIQSGLGVF